MYFHFAVKKSEVLRLQQESARAEESKDESDDSPIKMRPMTICNL
jgi:hypothetical protein